VKRRLGWLLPVLAVSVHVAPPRTAFAQGDATAEILFRDGKRLLAERKYAQACPKFAESARIAPSSGVGLALGLCYEASGKTASAWGAFTAVIALARRDQRRDRERVAAAHAKALEPKLAHVVFVVDKDAAMLEGFELRVDGAPLGSAAWADSPVDPGDHQVEAVAPGYKTHTTTFTSTNATTETVTIPPLIAIPPPPPQAPPPPPAEPVPWRTIAYGTGGVGLATILVGAIVGAVALEKANDAEKACPQSTCANAAAVSENGSAGSLADASTGLFIVGGLLIGAGVATYFLAPSPSPADASRKSQGGLAGSLVAGVVLSPRYLGYRAEF
jgi:hypothetical protein